MPVLQAKQQDSVSPLVHRNVTPKHGEKYVQIAAFGPKALESYLRQLESNGLHPVIAPGPSDGIFRILIGPYTNMETLEQTRRTLQVVGMDSIVRAY
jgi:cell division protein FtsN